MTNLDLINKKAFSLAEAMVVLVIISILMAVSAPLIAKKAAADQNRAVIVGTGGNIFAAQGANQSFNIGPNGVNSVDRLKVFGKTTINGKTLINAQTGGRNDSNNTNDTIAFRVAPIGEDIVNPAGFIVYGNGTTNVGGCMPDYEHSVDITDGFENMVDISITKDGYILSTLGVRLTSNSTNYEFYPSIRVTSLKVNKTTGAITGAGQIVQKFVGYILIPVNKGDQVTALDYIDEGEYYQVEADEYIFNHVPCK